MGLRSHASQDRRRPRGHVYGSGRLSAEAPCWSGGSVHRWTPAVGGPRAREQTVQTAVLGKSALGTYAQFVRRPRSRRRPPVAGCEQCAGQEPPVHIQRFRCDVCCMSQLHQPAEGPQDLDLGYRHEAGQGLQQVPLRPRRSPTADAVTATRSGRSRPRHDLVADRKTGFDGSSDLTGQLGSRALT